MSFMDFWIWSWALASGVDLEDFENFQVSAWLSKLGHKTSPECPPMDLIYDPWFLIHQDVEQAMPQVPVP